MASLSTIWIKKETLKALYETVEKKGEKGVELTISINDELNQFNQNVSSWVRQTKSQREAKKDRFWTGNGKCFWTDEKITAFGNTSGQPNGVEPSGTKSDDDDLPF